MGAASALGKTAQNYPLHEPFSPHVHHVLPCPSSLRLGVLDEVAEDVNLGHDALDVAEVVRDEGDVVLLKEALQGRERRGGLDHLYDGHKR